MRVFIDRGWACDRVYSDYGEDLVIQTTMFGQVDPFRTLAQVKTRKNGGPQKPERGSRHLALRWIPTAEPVLFVVWDPVRNRGCYALPQQILSEYKLLPSSQTAVGI